MPRIPVRTEPYTSPSRQHRHFKNKRDQVLRALGKAAYINGSHFAIMWVSARGEVETYASDALQSKLDEWFVKRGLAEEAKELVKASRPVSDRPQSAAALAFPGLDIDDDEGVDEDDEDLDHDSVPPPSTSTTPNLTLNNNEDVFIDAGRSSVMSSRPAMLGPSSALLGSNVESAATPPFARFRRAMAPLDTNVAREHFQRDLAVGSSSKHALPGTLRPPVDSVERSIGVMPHSAPLRGRSSMLTRSVSTGNIPLSASTSSSSSAGLTETTFANEAARTAFLELRFSQLQQGMCKTVSKAWIKIIEPKKQTRCPYNRGEEGKPEWWPQGVRHKEPDHLMKPERHALLLTILRSPKVKIARLQLATAEVVALMKADKVSLLMDVYRIAREEESRRAKGGDKDAPLTVAVSTLDGWSETEQCAVSSPERPSSPTPDDYAPSSRSSRKRPAMGTPMSRSASSSAAFRANKRVAGPPVGLGIGLDLPGPSSTPATLGVPSGLQRRSANNSSTWLMHEPSRHGVKRTSVTNHPFAPSPAGFSAPSPHLTQPHLFGDNGGISGPMQAHAHIGDPSMLTQNQEHAGGYAQMPSPHLSSLGPHVMPQMPSTRPAVGQPLHASSSMELPPEFYPQLAGSLTNGGHNALGLQGMDASWHDMGAPSGLDPGIPGSFDAHSAWWHGQELDGRISAQASAQHAVPMQMNGIAVSPNSHGKRANPSSGSAPHSGTNPADGSFDASFASTLESVGPGTPPETMRSFPSASASNSLSRAGLFPSTSTTANKAPLSSVAPPLPFDPHSWMYSQDSSQ